MGSNIHLISGLPRSGSTLLSALLRQNPKFEAGMSSGLYPLISNALRMMSAGTELSRLIPETKRKQILSGIFASYYPPNSTRPIVFDTHRGWCGQMSLLNDLYPEAKVIACVRDVSWVMDSFERVYQKNPYENTALFGLDAENNVYGRMNALIRGDRIVGNSWSNLKEAFYGQHASKLLILDYKILATAPDKVLRLIYEFIGEEWYDGHDYEAVEYDAPDFDDVLGAKGLHKVRPKVELTPRETILPPDLFNKFQDMDFWSELKSSRANVITASKAK